MRYGFREVAFRPADDAGETAFELAPSVQRGFAGDGRREPPERELLAGSERRRSRQSLSVHGESATTQEKIQLWRRARARRRERLSLR